MSTPSTTTIVSVDRVVMFDGRIVSQESTAPENPTSLVSQLSPAGLEKLEPTHEEPLPWPSMAEFNSTMTANMSRVDFAATTLMSEPLCVPLTEIDAFKSTSAWPLVLNDSRVAWGAWKAANASCQAGVTGLPCVALGPARLHA